MGEFMKNFKPQKQTVLKGLLFLVVGLNFSWEALFVDHHQQSFSSVKDTGNETVKSERKSKAEKPAEKKSGAAAMTIEVGGDKDPYKGKRVEVCDQNFGMKQYQDGTLKLLRISKDNTESVCEDCNIKIMNGDQEKNTPDKVWDQVSASLVTVSCENLMSPKERAEKMEQQRLLAIDILNCLADSKGDDLSKEKKIDCQRKNMSASNKKFKDLGIDAKEADEDRAKMAKAVEKSSFDQVKKVCKMVTKDESNLDECKELQNDHKDLLGDIADLDNKDLEKFSKAESKKLDGLIKFVSDEEKAIASIGRKDQQLDSLISKFEYGKQFNQDKCDRAAAQADSTNQAFNTDACVQASNAALAQQLGPNIKQLSTAFITEENAYAASLARAAKLDYVGQDGASEALTPYREFKDKLVTFGNDYGVAATNLPKSDGTTSSSGSSSTAASQTATPSSLATAIQSPNFSQARLGGGIPSFRPNPVGTNTIPAVLTQSNPGARQYNQMALTPQTVTSGMRTLGGTPRAGILEMI
jgi:hypothetical protein